MHVDLLGPVGHGVQFRLSEVDAVEVQQVTRRSEHLLGQQGQVAHLLLERVERLVDIDRASRNVERRTAVQATGDDEVAHLALELEPGLDRLDGRDLVLVGIPRAPAPGGVQSRNVDDLARQPRRTIGRQKLLMRTLDERVRHVRSLIPSGPEIGQHVD